MRSRKSEALMLAAAVAALSLAGCSTSTSNSSPSSTTTNKTIDIKDIVLTNLSADCADYSASYEANVKDLKQNVEFISKFEVSDDEKFCTIKANDIPNYDFNDASAHWAEPIAEQGITLTIPRNPKVGESKTDLSLNTYNAVMLNGVVLDQLANGCYKPSDPSADQGGNIANGCGPSADWRLDPMGKVKFGTDSHNGHTQPGGLYHYHGNPNALYDPEETSQGSPVIGFAADGFPIFGPHYLDQQTGKMLEAKSGYSLKSGSRPTTEGSPGGTFDGTYIQDYEFTNSGTLDECNGMTIGGQYGYYVTSTYPYVMGCYAGTPNFSFAKTADTFPWITVSAIAMGLASLLVVGWRIFRTKTTRPANEAYKTRKKRYILT